ncbi:MAG: RraA family protein, partial [Rhodospirillales bacterium]|nr:RraA family protein [Rhodospirillales bacterium]
MPIYRHERRLPGLGMSDLEAWRAIPTAVASDCMNRAQTMSAAIKPLAPGTKLCAQARTVECMVGDNSAIHAALRLVGPGEALVIAAGGYADTALWGGLLTRAALARGLAGVVLDGAARDAAEIREHGFACFASAIVPAGPHKGFGGTLDGVVSCGGCSVAPGDLVLGDDDGIAVVPLGRQAQILAAAQDKIAQEGQALERLAA